MVAPLVFLIINFILFFGQIQSCASSFEYHSIQKQEILELRDVSVNLYVRNDSKYAISVIKDSKQNLTSFHILNKKSLNEGEHNIEVSHTFNENIKSIAIFDNHFLILIDDHISKYDYDFQKDENFTISDVKMIIQNQIFPYDFFIITNENEIICNDCNINENIFSFNLFDKVSHLSYFDNIICGYNGRKFQCYDKTNNIKSNVLIFKGISVIAENQTTLLIELNSKKFFIDKMSLEFEDVPLFNHVNRQFLSTTLAHTSDDARQILFYSFDQKKSFTHFSLDNNLKSINSIVKTVDFMLFTVIHANIKNNTSNYQIEFHAISLSPCPFGFYSETGLNPCLPSPIGHYVSDLGSTGFESCMEGTYQSKEGQKECLSCPNGTVSVITKDTCVKCPKQHIWVFDDPSYCKICEYGHIVVNNTCVECPYNHYEKDGFCLPCDVGKYTISVGKCVQCPKNSIMPKNESHCVKCPDSHIARDNACYRCEGSEYFNVHDGTCIKCPVGHVPDKNHTKCVRCAEGTYSSIDRCDACVEGQVSDGSRDYCVECAPGYYVSSLTTCSICPLGYYSSAGSKSCTRCSFFHACDSTPLGKPKLLHMYFVAPILCLVFISFIGHVLIMFYESKIPVKETDTDNDGFEQKDEISDTFNISSDDEKDEPLIET
eukprot:TRINITY_DN2909_c0_g1_i1.p1 TRINITY_DN2909_c0_g1~~TRINITY_DN2909_c0_g1_i1.p1  ORF type:complete len:659 (+),score=171.80 TRINITY_DN2909_c0_g1_i1:45-2021(+)